MKSIKIEIPKGYEVDKDKSTFEEIVFKRVDNFGHLPKIIEEVENRIYYINDYGEISSADDHTPNNLSTKERAEAFLALMQLVELRDTWNESWKPDWNDSSLKWVIKFNENRKDICDFFHDKRVLHFKSKELAVRFLDQFSDLIEQAKELL